VWHTSILVRAVKDAGRAEKQDFALAFESLPLAYQWLVIEKRV
jgi:hypothetical protein